MILKFGIRNCKESIRLIDWTPNDLKSHLDSGKSVFLKLWKPGCGACKLSEPATERLEAKYGEDSTFAKVDVSTHPEMLEISESEVLPAFFRFAEGKLAGKVVGFKGIKKLEELFI